MEKKRYGRFKSRSNKILKILKDGKFWTATEIHRELIKTEKISLPGVLKSLKKMIRDLDISYFDLNFGERVPKRYKNELLDLRQTKRLNSKASKYYIYLPLRIIFRDNLRKALGDLYEKRRYRKKIWEILKVHGSLELWSIKVEKGFNDFGFIKKTLKKRDRMLRGKRISKDYLKWRVNLTKDFIESFDSVNLEMDIPIKRERIKEKDYCLIGDDYIPIEKLIRFIRLIPLNAMMKVWAASDDLLESKKNIFKVESKGLDELFNKMLGLFEEIIKDSQIKI